MTYIAGSMRSVAREMGEAMRGPPRPRPTPPALLELAITPAFFDAPSNEARAEMLEQAGFRPLSSQATRDLMQHARRILDARARARVFHAEAEARRAKP